MHLISQKAKTIEHRLSCEGLNLKWFQLQEQKVSRKEVSRKKGGGSSKRKSSGRGKGGKGGKKKAYKIVRLVSDAGTGFFYSKKKSRGVIDKLQLMKYDPRVKHHVLFKEVKWSEWNFLCYRSTCFHTLFADWLIMIDLPAWIKFLWVNMTTILVTICTLVSQAWKAKKRIMFSTKTYTRRTWNPFFW